MESYFKRAVLYDANSKRKNDIDNILTEMVVKDVQPFSIVENEGFISTIHIVKFFVKSSITNENLKLVEENGAYTLLQEAPTRWNSFHDVIKIILLTHKAIASLLLSHYNSLQRKSTY